MAEYFHMKPYDEDIFFYAWPGAVYGNVDLCLAWDVAPLAGTSTSKDAQKSLKKITQYC